MNYYYSKRGIIREWIAPLIADCPELNSANLFSN
ncbi:hypothetical protein [Plasmodium yoelii yoelii]|uniref:Uncharacterized protein n=1 Tax=Plasmodium yoelii yoelii TaxID=73239 RepID=Q7RFQ3_PLAYO|nr:hypothetical protein [Plasmodium yoelii yoelii]